MVIEVNIAQPIILEVFNTVTEERVLEIQAGGLVTTTDLASAVTAAASSAGEAAASATAAAASALEAANVPTFSGVLENALVRKTSTGVASSLLFDTGVFLRTSANLVLGATVSQGNRLEVTGNSLFTGNVTVTGSLITSQDITVNGIRVGRGGGNNPNNTIFGNTTGENITTGDSNTIIGQAINNLTTGNANTLIGRGAGSSISTISNNTAVGRLAIQSITGGGSLLALGFEAGRFIVAGTSSSIQSNSLFIGNDSRPLANDQTNQIVIGHASRGLGSNTTVIGNSSTQTFGMWGQLRFMALTSPPSSMTATGIAGEWRATSQGLFYCVTNNNWVKIATTTF